MLPALTGELGGSSRAHMPPLAQWLYQFTVAVRIASDPLLTYLLLRFHPAAPSMDREDRASPNRSQLSAGGKCVPVAGIASYFARGLLA